MGWFVGFGGKCELFSLHLVSRSCDPKLRGLPALSIKRLVRPVLIAIVPAALAATAIAVSLPAGAAHAGAPARVASHKQAAVVNVFPGAATLAGRAGLDDTQTGPNWAGFVVTGPKFRYVKATFYVPRLNCHKTPGSTRLPALGADWVGLDGYNQSNPTVEQDGVTAQCQNGVPSYSAWYEMFPKPPVYPNMVISPGDKIVADVFYDRVKHKYRLDLADVTDGQGFSLWQRCPNHFCQNISAEVITESPAESASVNSKYYPLADIGTSNFWHVAVSDMAGQKAGLSSGSWNTTRLVMTGNAGRVKASTSGLGGGGTAFRTYWEHAS